MIALFFSFALAAECPPVEIESFLQFAIRAHGHTLGGNAAVSIDQENFALTALSGAGTELFSVQVQPSEGGRITEVRSAFPEWKPWLERLPFQRDLVVALNPATEACELPFGTLRTSVTSDGWKRKFRGAGGRVTAVRAGNSILVRDRKRGYRLTMVLPDAL